MHTIKHDGEQSMYIFHSFIGNGGHFELCSFVYQEGKSESARRVVHMIWFTFRLMNAVAQDKVFPEELREPAAHGDFNTSEFNGSKVQLM